MLFSFIGVFLLIFLPGFLMTAILFPRSEMLSFSERLVLSFLLSLTQSVLLGIIFTTIKLFTPTTTWLGLLVGTAGWTFMAYRSKIAWRAIFAEMGRALPTINIIFVGIIGWLVFWPLGTWTAETENYGRLSSWAYYAQAVFIVRAESIPSFTTEYGTSMYFITNKIGINLLTAQGIHLAPDASHITIMLVAQLIIALICLVGAWAFLRNFMNPVWLSFVIISLSWLRHLNFKLGSYRAESAGIALFFITMLCIHKSFENRKFVWASLAGLGIGLTSITHGVPGLVLIFWYTALTLTHLSLEWRRFFERLPHLAITTLVTFVLVVFTFLVTSGGRISNQEAVFGEQTYGDIQFEDATLALRTILGGEGIPPEDNVTETPEEFYVNPVEIRDTALDYATSLFAGLKLDPAIGYGVLFLSLVLIAFQEINTRIFAYAFPILMSFIVLLGLWFSYRYDTVVLATHPLNREFPYLEIMGVIMLALGGQSLTQLALKYQEKRYVQFALIGLGSTLLIWVLRETQQIDDLGIAFNFFLILLGVLWGMLLIIRLYRTSLLMSEASTLHIMVGLVGAILVIYIVFNKSQLLTTPIEYWVGLISILFLGSLVIPQITWNSVHFSHGILVLYIVLLLIGMSELRTERRYKLEVFNDDGLQAYEWLAQNSDTDARIVSNVRTGGMVSVLTNRTSYTEGRTPYFQPENLNHALQTLIAVHGFYTCPNVAFLTDYPVDYVFYTRKDFSLGGNRFVDTLDTLDYLNAFESLNFEAKFGAVYIFAVDHEQLTSSLECN